MKYKDKEIGVPTFEQFCKIVSEVCGKRFSDETLYKTLSERKWKTKNGKPISDLERTLKGMCSSTARWSYLTKEAQEKGISNCPLCALGNDNNKNRIWQLKEMDADHVTAWSKGGSTAIENCQMLCKTHNRAKGNR